MENVALWHERDISHSSVERVIGPDATILAHFMLVRFFRVIDGLVVYPENMERNLNQLGGIHFSQRLMLALVGSGLTREAAYTLVQDNAMRVWAGEGDLKALVSADPQIATRLDPAALDAVFNNDAFVRHLDTIFNRVFGA
jgi:adenylosuccinate lyase